MSSHATNRQPLEDFQIFTSLRTPSIPERVQIGVHAKGLLSLKEMILAFRDELINAYLIDCQGNQCRVALALGMHRNTLGRIIEDMMSRDALKASLKRSDYKKTPQSAGGDSVAERLA